MRVSTDSPVLNPFVAPPLPANEGPSPPSYESSTRHSYPIHPAVQQQQQPQPFPTELPPRPTPPLFRSLIPRFFTRARASNTNADDIELGNLTHSHSYSVTPAQIPLPVQSRYPVAGVNGRDAATLAYRRSAIRILASMSFCVVVFILVWCVCELVPAMQGVSGGSA